MSDSADNTPHGRRSGVTIDQARALVKVYETHSYSACMRPLGVSSPSAVYNQIKRMADAIGTSSLGSSSNGYVTLTPAGWRLLAAAIKIVEAADTLRPESGAVRFSSYPVLAGRAASGIARFVNKKRAELPVDVDFYDISASHRDDQGRGVVRRVESGEIDVVIAPARTFPDNPRVSEVDAHTWDLRVVTANADMSEKATVRVSEIASLKLLVSPLGHHSRELVERTLREDKADAEIAMSCEDQWLMARIGRSSERYAAVVPSDALTGRRDDYPALVNSRGETLGGSYSLYYLTEHRNRAESAGPGDPEDRSQNRRSQDIHDLVQQLAHDPVLLYGTDEDRRRKRNRS